MYAFETLIILAAVAAVFLLRRFIPDPRKSTAGVLLYAAGHLLMGVFAVLMLIDGKTVYAASLAVIIAMNAVTVFRRTASA